VTNEDIQNIVDNNFADAIQGVQAALADVAVVATKSGAYSLFDDLIDIALDAEEDFIAEWLQEQRETYVEEIGFGADD
jgi:hypothetical protein